MCTCLPLYGRRLPLHSPDLPGRASAVPDVTPHHQAWDAILVPAMGEPQEDSVTPSIPEPAGTAVRQPTANQQPEAGAPAAPAAPRSRPGQPAGPLPGEREPIKPEAQVLAADIEDLWAGIPHEARFNFGDLEVNITPEVLLAACQSAKADPRLSFDYLMSLTGTDYESYLQLVYHLYSYRDHRRLTLRVKLDAERPSAPSVTGIWRGADWHEREAAEMLGIDFPGHPNLVPLLLDEDVDERPLRKSHPLVPIYEDRPGIVRRPQ